MDDAGAPPEQEASPAKPARLSPPLLAVALLTPLVLLGVLVLIATSGGPFGDGPSPARADTLPAARSNAFDGPAAYRLTARQVRAGQRPAGSPQLARLAEALRPLLPAGRFEALPGSTAARPLRNIVGTLPGTKPAIVLGAHYDTLVKPVGFVGANNGAAGSAVVIEVARALSRLKRPAGAPELRFVLFDGEEPDAGLPEEQDDFYKTGLRGSRAYVARHPRQTREMLLLDYVGGRRLSLPREGNSDPELWEAIRRAAARTGVGAVFPDRTGVPIQDDHTPFLRAGVPAVDFIDWSYPGHTLQDGMRQISVRALDAVGETVVAYLRRAR